MGSTTWNSASRASSPPGYKQVLLGTIYILVCQWRSPSPFPPFLSWHCAPAYFPVMRECSVLPLYCASSFSNCCTRLSFLSCPPQRLVTFGECPEGVEQAKVTGGLCRMPQCCITTRNLRHQWCRRWLLVGWRLWLLAGSWRGRCLSDWLKLRSWVGAHSAFLVVLRY